jgi:hypothetical protein
LLGRRKFIIAQHARIVKLGKLLKLGSKIYPWRLLNRRCILLLGLRICCALLISLIILLLRSGILRRIFLLLVVVNCTGSSSDNRSAYDRPTYASDRPSYHCSSS